MNADFKKNVFTLIVATFVGALVSCSFFDSTSEKPSLDESKKYGSLIINSSNARAIAIADVKYASVVVSGTGIQAGSEPSASNVSVTGGRGSSSPITNIPVGKNRIVTVQAYDSNNAKIDGIRLRAIVDIEAGSNSVVVNWATTALGSVFAKLHEDGVNISDISNSDKNAIQAAIDSSKHASLINVQEIASDYANGSLQSSAQYVLSPASLSFAAVNASGYTITVSDPLSVTKTLSTETSGSVTNIVPGNWTVTVKDGSSIKLSKKFNFASAQAESGRAYFGDHLEGTVTATGFGEYTATGEVAQTLSHPLAQHIIRLNKIRAAIPALQKGQYSTSNCKGSIQTRGDPSIKSIFNIKL